MKYIVDEKTNNVRIDKALSEVDSVLTRSYTQKLIEQKSILVNGKEVKASYKLKLGDTVDIEYKEPEKINVKAEDISLDIIYEDEDIIIINKPKGMVVHPGNGNYEKTMVNALMYSHKDNLSSINGVIRPGIVHRIDKDTSGILVVAKSDNAHKKLTELFKIHDIKRKYIALVCGIITKDNIKIDLPIGRCENDRVKMAVTKKNSRNAVTYVKVLKRFKKSNYTLIEATLETGRTHQIRVHMSYIGHPLVGDTVYSKGKNEFGVVGQMLHAKTLGFVHPIKNEYVEFESDLPKEFKNVLDILEKNEQT